MSCLYSVYTYALERAHCMCVCMLYLEWSLAPSTCSLYHWAKSLVILTLYLGIAFHFVVMLILNSLCSHVWPRTCGQQTGPLDLRAKQTSCLYNLLRHWYRVNSNRNRLRTLWLLHMSFPSFVPAFVYLRWKRFYHTAQAGPRLLTWLPVISGMHPNSQLFRSWNSQ